MMDLYFTELEMLDFLKLRGWIIKQENIPQSEHSHGSRVIFSDQKVWMAKKESESFPLEQAFRREIKKKILYE